MSAKDVKFSTDARDRMLRGVEAANDDTVVQGTKFHDDLLASGLAL